MFESSRPDQFFNSSSLQRCFMLSSLRHHFRFSRTLASILVLIVMAGCSSLDMLNAVTGKPNVAPVTLGYGASPRQRIDIYSYQVPGKANDGLVNPVSAARAADEPKLKPVVIFFYGGSWTYGSRQDYSFVAKAFLDQGYVVAIPDYRLSPEVTYPVFLQDSAAAVKKVIDTAREFGGDPDRIVLMGHSAGAYNAAMVAMDKRLLSDSDRRHIRGVIGLASPVNFLPIQLPEARVAFNWPNTPQDSQPIEHVSSDSPPMLLMIAPHDRLVDPVINSEQLAKKLQNAGVYVRLEQYELPLRLINHTSLVGTLSPSFQFAAPTMAHAREFLERVTR